eukprot:13702888-Ditylum_brightwellii.AAC.1
MNTPQVFARVSDLKLTVLFQVRHPESHYRAGRLVNLALIYPANADIDNYVKFVIDVVHGIIYYDDCCIHVVNTGKIFATQEHVGRTFIHIHKI